MVEPNNLKKANQLPFLNGLKLSSSSEDVAIKIAIEELGEFIAIILKNNVWENIG
jgi:hypothetical protein